MFRKPRELASPLATNPPPKPSTGRPPTPESITTQDISCTSVSDSFKMTSSTTPLIGRTKTTSKSSSRTPALKPGKAKPKPNGSILNFFKKAARSPETGEGLKDTEESLFLDDEGSVWKEGEPVQTPTPPRDDLLVENSPDFVNNLSMDADLSRFNEENGPIKRRKMEASESSPLELKYATKTALRKGPFIEDSDDDDDEKILGDILSLNKYPAPSAISDMASGGKGGAQDLVNLPTASSLKHEQTSIDGEDEFEGIDDFIDDEFPVEGEEYLERRWMEQERQFEMDGAEDAEDAEDAEPENNQVLKKKDVGNEIPNKGVVASCPVCSVDFDGLTDQVR